MALVPMKNLLQYAESKNIAVGAFGVGNMEMVIGAVAAAEELNTPIILSLDALNLKYSPIDLFGSVMTIAAKNSKVPIAVQLDRAQKIETVQKALGCGFTSVMFDGASLPLGENIQAVKQVKKLADEYGATVEAELGASSGDEANACTNPDDAKMFCDETLVDALAVSIGNGNGQLRFDVLDDINKMVETPLALRGGADIAAEILRQSVMLGIRKINVETACFKNLADRAAEYCKPRETAEYPELSRAMAESVYETVKNYIKIFNMQSEI